MKYGFVGVKTACGFLPQIHEKLSNFEYENVALKKGEFAPLVYARYLELVDRFKRKKVIDTENPLPMELCSVLAGYGLPLEVSGEERTKLYNDRYSELADLFIYAERVMYSDHATSAEEYSAFYRKLKEI